MDDLADEVERKLMIENHQMRTIIANFNKHVKKLQDRTKDLEDQIDKLKVEDEIKSQIIKHLQKADTRKDQVIGRLASKQSFHKWLDAAGDSV